MVRKRAASHGPCSAASGKGQLTRDAMTEADVVSVFSRAISRSLSLNWRTGSLNWLRPELDDLSFRGCNTKFRRQWKMINVMDMTYNHVNLFHQHHQFITSQACPQRSWFALLCPGCFCWKLLWPVMVGSIPGSLKQPFPPYEGSPQQEQPLPRPSLALSPQPPLLGFWPPKIKQLWPLSVPSKNNSSGGSWLLLSPKNLVKTFSLADPPRKRLEHPAAPHQRN